MTVEELRTFVSSNSNVLRRLNERQDTTIGFNAFSLVSSTYRRENFHSDIIAAILDPNGKHGEGKLFLKNFVEFLVRVAKVQGKEDLSETLENLRYDGGIRVLREDGRVDVKIEAADWVIIIENKINGAGDMQRQIPRYIDECGVEKVKAAVYLSASSLKEPGTYGWGPEDERRVANVLLPIIGYNETTSMPNLVTGWLDGCELSASGFLTRAVIAQYKELVRNQAGDTMNNDLIKTLMDSLAKQGLRYTELVAVLNDFPKGLANLVREAINGKPGVSSAWIWKEYVTVLELNAIKDVTRGKDVHFAIDVHCENLSERGVSFFIRSGGTVDVSAYLGMIRHCDSGFKMDEGWGRIVCSFSTDDVYGNVKNFIDRIVKIVDMINGKQAELEKIASAEV